MGGSAGNGLGAGADDVVDVDIAQKVAVPPFPTVGETHECAREGDQEEDCDEGEEEDVDVPDKAEVVEGVEMGLLSRGGDGRLAWDGGVVDDVWDRHVCVVNASSRRTGRGE